MSDELDLLRAAHPVPAHAPHFGDGPLDHRAERRLTALLGQDRRRFRVPRARLLCSLAAAAGIPGVVLVAVLGGPGGPPAVAAVGPPGLRRGTHVRSWSLGMSDDGPLVPLPEERVVRSNPDDSRTEVVVVTDPGHPGRPVLTDDGDTLHLVSDGRVMSRTTYPLSWSDAPSARMLILDRGTGTALSLEPRYLLRGPARGPLASGPGMTVAPCRRDDLGGGVTGPEGCRRRR